MVQGGREDDPESFKVFPRRTAEEGGSTGESQQWTGLLENQSQRVSPLKKESKSSSWRNPTGVSKEPLEVPTSQSDVKTYWAVQAVQAVKAVKLTHEGRKLWTSEYLSLCPPIPPSSLQGGGEYRRKEASHTCFIPTERLQ